MNNKLYVSNLSFSILDEALNREFSAFGTVTSASVVLERDSGRSRGFGFVEMSSEAEAQQAIEGLNGKTVEGRAINVSIARPKEARTDGGRGGRW